MAKTDPRDLVAAPALLKLLFPGKQRRSLRWLYLRIRAGDIPSRKVFNARLFDVGECRAAVASWSRGDRRTFRWNGK